MYRITDKFIYKYRLTDIGYTIYLEAGKMKCKECKVVCDGKEVATINCSRDGFSIKCTEEGKSMCKELKGCC